MEFKEYSKAVMAWVDGVMQNRGADAEKTLKYCADIEQYAKQTGDPKLLGFAYYYAGETYYVLNEGEQLLKTITRAITYLDQAEQWDMVARAYNILAIAFLNRGNTPIALDYYLTGLGYCKKYKLANEENVISEPSIWATNSGMRRRDILKKSPPISRHIRRPRIITG